MFVIGSLMCMLLVLCGAHVYERCELARELASLGVEKEHLATWVCIAYHESRFDTAARNHGSGDHGLLQISELYWCGPGKACGVPCSAFRDEDISDDVECAQKIYKEHTRLQGDGFLAWVVYPLYCKNNPKKYLAECEGSIKNGTDNIETKARSLNRNRNIAVTKSFQSNYIDTNRPKPSYLTINSIFERSNSKGIEDDNEIGNWLDFKIDNVDSLKLPVTKNGETHFIAPKTISTSTIITTDNHSVNKSPYLAIKSLFEGHYFKQFLDNNKHRKDWLDYKIENIDSLKLPVFNENGRIQFIAPSKSSTLYKATNIAKSTTNNFDESTVPYLAIKTFFEGSTYKQFQENYNKQRTNWLDYKIDNVDSLKLPVSIKNGRIQFIAPSNNYIKFKSTIITTPKSRLITTTLKPTTTTVDPELIGIKPPMPRKVESNQFRRRKVLPNINLSDSGSTKTKTDISYQTNNLVPLTVESSSQGASRTTTKPLTNKPSALEKINSHETYRPNSSKQIFSYQNTQSAFTNTLSNISSTARPIFNWYRQSKTPFFQETPKSVPTIKNNLTSIPVPTEHTTVKPLDKIFNFATRNYYTTSSPFVFNSSISQTPATSTEKVTETVKVTTPSPTKYNQKSLSSFFLQNVSNSGETRKTSDIKEIVKTIQPSGAFVTTQAPNFNYPFSNRFSHTYQFNPSAKQQANNTQVNSSSNNNTKNTNFYEYSSNSLKHLINSSTTVVTTTNMYNKNSSNVHLDLQTTRAWSSVTYPPTSKPQTASTLWKFSPFTYKSFQTTPSPVVTTVSPVIRNSTWTQNTTKSFTSTTKGLETSSKTTPSIFDLYLRPQKFTLPPFQFSPFNSSLHKIQIFSGGTTALPKSFLKT